MQHLILALTALGLALVSACTPPAATEPAQIAWRQGDVEDAFAEAAEAGKPVLLYWGAVWCPPCNRLKAGLFQDAAFIAQTRDFIPVYLDGDSAGAQLWGEHFAILGYPTLIILRPDRTEITRLSGGGDPAEIAQALAIAQRSEVGVAELIARAQTQPRRLSAQDWLLVAGYGWEVDAGRIVPAGQKGDVLQRLAAHAPNAALARRFELLAFAARDEHAALSVAQQERARVLLETIVADPAELRANREVLSDDGAKITGFAPPSGRGGVQAHLVAALDAVYNEEDLPISDRLEAINAEIEIFRQNAGAAATAPASLLQKVRERVRWADAAARTPYERQSSIYVAAQLLADVGDASGAERLLEGELARSHTPFYYMPILADLAEKRGDKAQALAWLKRGYDTSVGPASRVQWGVLYAVGVTRLAPDNAAEVEHAAAAVIDELAASPNSFHQRTRVRFDRVSAALIQWSTANHGSAVVERLRARMRETCPRTQSEADAREACAAWLATAT